MESNRDLLKEAIADAKAVKETALAQAKVALEEAFTPFLKETLATRIAALDEVDEVDGNMYEKENMEEGDYMMDEGDDIMDEELDLEALLAELEDDDDKKEVEEQLFEAEEDEDEDEEEFDIDSMSKKDLEEFIEEVVQDLISSGELTPTNPDMGDEPDMEEEPEMGDEEEINIDELLAEVSKEKMKAKMEKMRQMKKSAPKKDDEDEKLKEAYDVIRTLKGELNEINLLNAKLLYTNKIFKAKSLTESEKVKVLSAFDKATNVKEVKLVYESLSMNSAKPKSNIKESLGSASKVMSPQVKQPIIEVNDAFSRMQKLAGLK
jgi:hypothetical protein